VYHATGLPPAADGTQHWTTVELRHRSSKNIVGSCDTICMPARKPLRRAMDVMNVIGEFGGVVGSRFPFDGLSTHCNWRQALGLVEPDSAPEDSVDVVWDAALRFLAGGEAVLEAIKQLEVVVIVKRPESGLYRDLQGKKPPDVALGQQTWKLAELLSKDDYCESVVMRIPAAAGSKKSVASVKIRFHVRPLQAAPDLSQDRGHVWFDRNKLRRAFTMRARKLEALRGSLVKGAKAIVRQATQKDFAGASVRTSGAGTPGAQPALETWTTVEDFGRISADGSPAGACMVPSLPFSQPTDQGFDVEGGIQDIPASLDSPCVPVLSARSAPSASKGDSRNAAKDRMTSTKSEQERARSIGLSDAVRLDLEKAAKNTTE